MDIVIFLDIDGVLNHREYNLKHKKEEGNVRCVAPNNVEAFNELHDRLKENDDVNIDIVISSAWRELRDYKGNLDRLVGFLKENGLNDDIEIIGRTPKLTKKRAVSDVHVGVTSVPRGKEVHAWLEDNPGYDAKLVLDDMPRDDFKGLESVHVQPSFEDDGLSKRHVKASIEVIEDQM